MAVDKVSVVDFSAYSLDRDCPDPDRFQSLIDQVYHACTTIGFIYIKNSGIPSEKVERVFDVSKRFFKLKKEVKMKYELPRECMHGYVFMGRESAARLAIITNHEEARPHTDLREAFNYFPSSSMDHPQIWPEEIPELRPSMEALMEAGKPFLIRLLEVMARGLKCEDPFVFANAHAQSGERLGGTRIRSNNYPATSNIDVKEKQTRCGEHTDFGSVTLLFLKGQQAGLEVQNFDGEWIPAPPIDDTILVNIADTMQRWTSDRYISTKHRVVNPVGQDKHVDRQSIAYFCIPDAGTIIKCIDGSNKYPPIEMTEYTRQRYNKIQPY